MPLNRPLVPMHLFKNLDFVVLTIISAVGGMLYYSLNGLSIYTCNLGVRLTIIYSHLPNSGSNTVHHRHRQSWPPILRYRRWGWRWPVLGIAVGFAWWHVPMEALLLCGCLYCFHRRSCWSKDRGDRIGTCRNVSFFHRSSGVASRSCRHYGHQRSDGDWSRCWCIRQHSFFGWSSGE
jgi:hypothetical protein